MTLVERVREWFLLRELEQRTAKVPSEVHAKTSRTLRLSRQRRDAAEALFIAGFPAEALRLAYDAVERARDAIREGTGHVEPLETVDLPVFDDDVTSDHAELFREVLAEHTRLVSAHAELGVEAQEIARLRVSRIVAVAAAAILVVSGVIMLVRTPRVLKATASAQWDARYDAGNAVDGSESTDWVLPDRTAGWIEVQVIPPRPIKRVKLMNARNLPYGDRATNEFKVEAYDQGKIVKTGEGRFDGYSAEPTWRAVELGPKVDRIRIDVKSWYLTGGGFSEIRVE